MSQIVLRGIECDDEGNPEYVTVRMPVAVMAGVARVLGKLAPNTTNPPEDSPVCSEFYQAAVGQVFNRWWDDGIDDYFREAGQ